LLKREANLRAMKRSTFAAASLAAFAAAWPRRSRAAEPVTVLYAGSLVTVMERSVAPELAKQGIEFRGEAKGSNALANLISSGLRQPDVFISADPKLIDGLMGGAKPLARWGITFATTRLVIGYARGSRFAADFQSVARKEKKLADVLLEPGLRLGRTDPVLDPKGYRSIIATKLLAADGGPPDLVARLLGDDRNPAQILPEEALLARLESGDIDGAFLYSTEAVARNVPFVELPANANLGDPAQAAHYASVSVTVDGKTHVGGIAAYAFTIPTVAPHPATAERFITFLFSPDGRALLTKNGVTLIHPITSGDAASVPAAIRAALPA